jgi:MFS family permease
VVGLSTGAEFISAIVLRIKAGRYADRYGPARSVGLGLVWIVAGGLLCCVAAAIKDGPKASAAALLFGRVALGGGEGFLITGSQLWALAVAGPARSASVIGWVGTEMFSALALGAPLGTSLYLGVGFLWIGVMIVIAALVVRFALPRSPVFAPSSSAPASLVAVLSRISIPAICMGLVGFSYGALLSFSVVLFSERSWTPTWGAITSFSVALVGARVFVGSLPDRIGGTKAALLSIGVLVAGLALTAAPGSVGMGLTGTALCGLGYAIVYPALSREAVLLVGAEDRGSTVAIMSASIFVTLGLGNPSLGLVAEFWGTASVCAFATFAATGAAMILLGRRGPP